MGARIAVAAVDSTRQSITERVAQVATPVIIANG
jgi:hypothetical protein